MNRFLSAVFAVFLAIVASPTFAQSLAHEALAQASNEPTTSFAVVEQATGKIVNRIVVKVGETWTPPAGLMAVAEDGQSLEIGGTIIGGVYTAPPPSVGTAVTAIPPISARQFYQQLAIAGIITEEQALAASKGTIPAPLLSMIAQMPTAAQFGAKMILSGATVFERNHPLTIEIGSAYGMSSADIDAFFRAAVLL